MQEAKFEFTNAALTAIQPGEKRTYFRDSESALVLAVGTTRKTFQLVKKLNGKVLRVTLGYFEPNLPARQTIPSGVDPMVYIGNAPLLNIRMARALALSVAVALGRGVNPVTAEKDRREAIKAELTLEEAFEIYRDRQLIAGGRRKVEETGHIFRRLLGRPVEDAERKKHGQTRRKTPGSPDWSRRRLSEITKDEIRTAMEAIRAGGSVYGGNMMLVLLRAVVRKMIAEDSYKGDDPTIGVKKFAEVSRDRFIKGDEAARFFTALADQPKDLQDFVMLALGTGARKSNLFAMRWGDLDLYSALWTIPGEKSKNGEPMTIPLTGLAMEVLRARQGNDLTWVFPGDSAEGHVGNIRRGWAALLKVAKVDDLRIHDLRRSLGSWSAITGASLPIIGAALGHKSQDSTTIYARLSVAPVRAAMEKAQSALLDAGGVRRA
jgi:integrase